MVASMPSAAAGKRRNPSPAGLVGLSHLRRRKRPELGIAWIDLGAIPS
jgi:hypothetical protein